jgi:hypothetical protein
MMNLLELILEGRREDFLKQYSSKFSRDELKTIISLSQNLSPNNKFLMFLGKTLTPKRIEVDKVVKLIDEFKKYQKVLDEKDINNYDSLDSLEQAISKHENKLRREVKKIEGADVIYEDDRFSVILPLNYKSSCYYGSGTKWCVTSSESYFDRYNGDGKVFFVIDKTAKSNDKFYKVAIQQKFDGDTVFWDVTDTAFNEGWILNSEEWKKIRVNIMDYMDENFRDMIEIFKDKELKRLELERQRRQEQINRRSQKMREVESNREDGIYLLETDTRLSNSANAVWEVLLDGNTGVSVNEGEDIYLLVSAPFSYGNLLSFEWLGEDNFESVFAVGNDNQADRLAEEMMAEMVTDNGVENMVSAAFLESHIDTDLVVEYFEDYYRNDVYENPEIYLDEENRMISPEQEKLIEDLEEKINSLNVKIKTLNQLIYFSTDTDKISDANKKIEDTELEIDEANEEIESIKESPEGDYPEELIEEAIENRLDEIRDNPMSYLQEMGLEINNFINIDSLVKEIIQVDGRGHVISSYDGNEYEANVNNKWYFVYRTE